LVRVEILIAHNPKVVGSNPTPATIEHAGQPHFSEWGLLLLGGASTGSSTGPGSAGAGDLRIRGGVRR